MHIVGQLSIALVGDRTAAPCEDCPDRTPHERRWIVQSPWRTALVCDHRLVEASEELAYNPRPASRATPHLLRFQKQRAEGTAARPSARPTERPS